MTNGTKYKKYADRHAPRLQSFCRILGGPFCGRLICCLGQFFAYLYGTAGLPRTRP